MQQPVDLAAVGVVVGHHAQPRPIAVAAVDPDLGRSDARGDAAGVARYGRLLAHPRRRPAF
jgi:hypothetical protein